jgi:hypothetical protein
MDFINVPLDGGILERSSLAQANYIKTEQPQTYLQETDAFISRSKTGTLQFHHWREAGFKPIHEGRIGCTFVDLRFTVMCI